MTQTTKLLIVLSVLVVAGAGAAAFVLTSKTSTPTAAPTAQSAPQAAPPAVEPAGQAPAQEAQVPAAPAADVPAVQFNASIDNYSLTRDSAAYSAPSLDAPQFYPLRAGTGLVSAAKSPDNVWIIAMTEDGQAAYIPAADLGPYDPSRVPMLENIQGPAEVIDTATLNVNGQKITLWGIVGQAGDYATGLQQLIDSQGSSVNCTLKDTAYLCTTPDGQDIARSSLFNGAASAGPDASDDYKAQQDAATAGHRGIWSK